MLCERSPPKLLNKPLEKEYLRKIPKKKFIFIKVAGPKIEFIRKYFLKVFAKSLSNLVHDFWEDCCPNPKLLLAADRLIYLNISIGIIKITE